MPPDIQGMPEPIALSATSDTPDPVVTETPVAPAPEANGETPAAETPEGDAGEAGEEGAAGETPAAAAPKGNKFGERLSEMAAQRRVAEDARRAADARADKLADLLEKTLAGIAPQRREGEAEQPDPRPSRDAFADPDSYDAALIEWSSRTATKLAASEFERREGETREKAAREQQEQQARQQFATVQAQYAERRAALIADPQYSDFEEVAETDALRVTTETAFALMHTENGPRVLYHLGKNPQEATRIAGLDPMQQAIEIGRISASLEQTNRPPVRKPIPAVEPVGSRNAAAPKSPDEMTTEEYAASRMPQLQSERRAGMWGRPPH